MACPLAKIEIPRAFRLLGTKCHRHCVCVRLALRARTRGRLATAYQACAASGSSLISAPSPRFRGGQRLRESVKYGGWCTTISPPILAKWYRCCKNENILSELLPRWWSEWRALVDRQQGWRAAPSIDERSGGQGVDRPVRGNASILIRVGFGSIGGGWSTRRVHQEGRAPLAHPAQPRNAVRAGRRLYQPINGETVPCSNQRVGPQDSRGSPPRQ